MTQYTSLGQSLLALERAARQQHLERADAAHHDPSDVDVDPTAAAAPAAGGDQVSPTRRDSDNRASTPSTSNHKGLKPPRRADVR